MRQDAKIGLLKSQLKEEALQNLSVGQGLLFPDNPYQQWGSSER